MEEPSAVSRASSVASEPPVHPGETSTPGGQAGRSPHAAVRSASSVGASSGVGSRPGTPDTPRIGIAPGKNGKKSNSGIGGFAKVLMSSFLRYRSNSTTGEQSIAGFDDMDINTTTQPKSNDDTKRRQSARGAGRDGEQWDEDVVRSMGIARSKSVPGVIVDTNGRPLSARLAGLDPETSPATEGALNPSTHSRVLIHTFYDHRPKQTRVKLDHPDIYFIGRVHWAAPDRPVYDWAGTTVGFRFEGTGLSIRMNGGGNYFNVVVDGRLLAILATNSQEELYTLADGLEDTVHSFELYKRTESMLCTPLTSYRPVELYDIRIDADRKLWPHSRRSRQRRIEFIGDSDVCGFGNEYNSPKDDFVPHLSNSYNSFAGKTARMFDAEAHIIALSGKGVVHNAMDLLAWDGKSTTPMISYYDRTLARDKSIKWNPNEFQADCVIIYLGTNDYLDYNNIQWLPFRPTDSEFTNGYADIIKRARAAHPHSKIFCVIPNESNVTYAGKPHAKLVNTLRKCIPKAAEKFQHDKDVHTIQLEAALSYPEDFGAIHHWNVRASTKISVELVEKIGRIMEWDSVDIDFGEDVLDTPAAQPPGKDQQWS